MRIALDAAGGDHGYGPNVAGAAAALNAAPDLTVLLVGEPDQLDPLLAAANLPAGRFEVVAATQVVGMHEKPADALRKKPDSSIAKCWGLVATGKADGLVSAGNTGATVAGGLITKKFLKCCRRPGIATVMPTAKGKCVLMDVGANVVPKPRDLVEYGVMGAVFAREMLGIAAPKIGLMNVGEEQGKGNELVQQAEQLFRTGPVAAQFFGNVEGSDVHRGTTDVIVCDGFVGNVILKLSEGLFEFVVGTFGKEILAKLPHDAAVGRQLLDGLVQKLHYSAVGGAPLLGVDGVCIICHGSSGERAIANALAAAAQNVRVQLNSKIVAELETLPAGE